MSQAQNAPLILPSTDHEGHGWRLAPRLGRGLLRTPDNRQAGSREVFVTG